MTKSSKKNKSKIVLIVGLLILTGALFLATQLVQKNQENRSNAAGSRTSCMMGTKKVPVGEYTCGDGKNYGSKIGSVYDCTNNSANGGWKFKEKCDISQMCVGGLTGYNGFTLCFDDENKKGNSACKAKGGVCSAWVKDKQANGDTCSQEDPEAPQGKIVKGLCTGDYKNRVCCLVGNATSTPTIKQDTACKNKKGICKKTSSACSGGSFVSNLCPSSGNDIKCCVPKN
ncbi:MAG: hypothetical protein WCG91_03820 [Candidatus Shapirobacteria bacterium]